MCVLAWDGEGGQDSQKQLRCSELLPELCLQPAVPSCGGHWQARAEVCAAKGDVVLTLVPSAGLSGTPWVLLVSDESPWVGTTVANRPQDRAVAWLRHPSDGAGPWVPACGRALTGQRWAQALSSWCSAELTKNPWFCQPTRVKSAALFQREELWCCKAKGHSPLPLPLGLEGCAPPASPHPMKAEGRAGKGSSALSSLFPSRTGDILYTLTWRRSGHLPHKPCPRVQTHKCQ